MSAQIHLSRRGLIKLAGAGTAAGAFAACAPTTGTPQPVRPGAGLEDDGVKDFTFTAWSLNEASTKDVLAGMVDSYTGGAGGRIATASYPYSDYLNQVLLQIRGGTLTGAIQLDVNWLATLAATGKLADLAAMVDGVGYTDSAVGMGRVKDVQYGLPWTSAGIGLIANSELLSKARVTAPPKTLTEFEDVLRALKGLGGGVVPYAAMTKVAQLKDIIAWLWTFGSGLIADGKVTLGDDASVEALTWYKKLYDGGLIAKDVDRFDARALFGQGKVGFYDDAIAGRGAVVKASPDKDMAGKLMPVSRPVRSSGGTPRHLAWGHVVVVLSGKGMAAAARFARALTSDPKYTVDWFKQAGLPPTTAVGLAAPEVKAEPFTVQFTERIGAFSTPSPLSDYAQYAQLEQILANQVQAILVGRASPKDGMIAARDQMQALIK
jgi:multiple sugar transport system substrate-binding protein